MFIGFCGLILHSMLLHVFVKDPLKCFRNFTMSFVINLEVCELIVCFYLSLQSFVKDVPIWFSIFNFLSESAATAAYLTIVAISIDRLLIVAFPMKHRCWITRKVIAIWLSCIWLASLLYGFRRICFDLHRFEKTIEKHLGKKRDT